jgi:PAS domain S-box-containing protein
MGHHAASGAEAPRPEHVLQAVAHAATAFLRSSQLDEVVPSVLRRLGEATRASRVYIFECREEAGRRLWSQHFEWAAPGIESQIGNPILQDAPLEEIGFGRWAEVLGRGGFIRGRREEFPPAERRLMETQGILALVAMPIFVRDLWWGFIGFDDCVRGEPWPEDVVTALGAAADLFGAMLTRRELEDRFRCLTEATSEGLVIHDGERILDVNRRALELLGYEREEVVGHDPFSFIGPLSADAARERARSGSQEPYEAVLQRKDGTAVPAELRGGGATYGGRAVRMVSVVDLTARKEAARKVRALLVEQVARAEAERGEQKARFLAEASRVLASSFDYSSAVGNVADLAVRYLGGYCMVDVLEGDRVRRVAAVHADPARRESVQKLVEFAPELEWENDPVVRVLRTAQPLLVASPAELDPSSLSYRFGYRDLLVALGSRSAVFVPIRVRTAAIGVLTLVRTEPGLRFTVADLRLAQDVADRMGLAIENARLYADAVGATRARDDILAVVAHDLRNPLGAIIGGATLIQEVADADRVRGFAANIRRSAERMNSLIQDLLEVSRMERGHLRLDLADLEPRPLIEEAVSVLRPLAAPRSITLTAELPAGLPPVRGDAVRLLQVFSNVIGNAIKFVPEGGSITVTGALEEDAVRFSVSDTGPGIPEDQLPHLFTRYWQADPSDRRGAGLGLSIAYGIVQAHGGRIWAVSERGKGSTFHFRIPLASGEPVLPPAEPLMAVA